MSQGLAPPSSAERLVTGRPRHFPTTFAWLSVGFGRNWRGVFGALVATWFYLPFALFVAVVSAVVMGLLWFSEALAPLRRGIPEALDLPLVSPILDSFLLRDGGVLSGLLGILLGLVLGFVGALLWFWADQFTDDPVAGLGWLLGVVAAGMLLGVLYTVFRVACERMLLRAAGARRLSRREQALLLPIVLVCARRLGLPNHPPILINDNPEPTAIAYTRHIVLSRGLLTEFDYDREVIAGVVSHALVHWRNGDAISAAFVRGVALPLYLIYGFAGWVMRQLKHPLIALLVWLLLWPVLLTVRYFIMPLQAADTRQAEFRADQGAVLAGYRDGLRRVIARLGSSFETTANGWSQSVSATHPASELRLERLEDPARQYPLPDPDAR
ncbi:MAG TPA: M48 family metalloprotease [Natronosporangium sp.]